MKKKNSKNIKGITLIEILIGIVVSSIMMGAMYATYSAVNSTYSQVTDRAKISQSGRDVLGMMIRDIRMAGFKYFNDNIQSTNEHIPILITKSGSAGKCCDQIDIVYGDVSYSNATPPVISYSRYKITYSGKVSTLLDKTTGQPIDAYAIFKSKRLWVPSSTSWEVPSGNDKFYDDVKVVDYVVDLEFVPIDEVGLKINPPPTANNANKDKIYKIKIVDIILTTRSTKPYFRSNITQTIYSLADSTRNISKTDKYLRDSVVISAHTRNLGFQ
jgi:type II secretory pathway pseudopilin PulG